MKKGEIYEGVITDYSFPNKGSLTMEDRRVTIKGALKGQRVRFMLTKKKSGMAEGRLLEVIEKSPVEDAEPECEYFGLCGGCAYQTMSYERQLELKEDMVRRLLDRYLGETEEEKCSVWEGILASPVQRGYRNKMEFTFGDEYKGGPLALGLHKKGGFYDILNVSGCKIIDENWSKILDTTLEFFRDRNIPFYHKLKHEGVLRNLVVRQSKATGEFLVMLVASTQWGRYDENEKDSEPVEAGMADCVKSPKLILGEYVASLRSLEASPDFTAGIAGILYTENDSLADVVHSDRTILLSGRDYIIEKVNELEFKISPFSFFQTNTKGCEVLYNKAREYVMSGHVMGDENRADKVVFDLYSGTGTIAQLMAPAAKKVIGIEIVEEAVEAARENAKINHLDNCEFIAGDVLKAIDLVEDKPDVIILDPPRDGINPKALAKILNFNVDEMIYISCKPTSLARDLELITAAGYKVKRACACDQFPGTVHVETVCLLSRKP